MFTTSLFLLPILIPGQVSAQDLTYTTLTTVEMGGAMGAMMRMVPDLETEFRQTTFMKGSLVRTDSGDSSTILDASTGTVTQIDHESRSYFTLSMEEMLAQAQEARERAEEAMGAQGGYPGGMPTTPMMAGGGQGAFEPEFSFRRTGAASQIQGFPAEQVLMTMEMVPVSPEAQEMAAAAGTQVLVTNSWYGTGIPAFQAMAELNKRLAEEWTGGLEGIMRSPGAMALMANPMIQEMMEEARQEMEGLEGMPVKTVSSFVTVPAGAELDLDAVLAGEGEPLEVEEGMSMQDLAREAARGAMGRRLGGLLGQNREAEEADVPAGPAVQTITMRTTTLIQDLETRALSEELFQPPAGYAERRPDWLRGG